MEQLELIYLSPKQLKTYNNKLRINYKSIQMLFDSIEQFGFINPVLISKDYVIISGEARVEVALKLELDKIPCIMLEHFNEDQAKAYRVLDNHIAENSWWNYKKKNEEVKNIKINLLKFELPEDYHSIIDIDEFFEEQKIKQESMFDMEELL